jgi:hypothetical protein
VKNRFILFGLLIVILSAGVGLHYRIPLIITATCVGLALFSAVTGLRMIVTRTAVIPTSDSFDAHKEYHTGLAAQFWGILFLMFSVPLSAFGIGYWLYGDNPPVAAINRMIASPLISGLAITASGAGVTLYGLTRLVAGKYTFAETRIGPFERTVMGVYAVTMGLLIAAAGVVRMVAPGVLTRMRDSAIAWALSLVK